MILGADQDKDSLIVNWDDGTTSLFHYVWLRDNCLCTDCGNPMIGRKTLRLRDFPLNIRPASLANDVDEVRINWDHDGHESTYSAAWLAAHAYEPERRQARQFQPTLWDKTFLKAPPEINYGRIENSDSGLNELLLTVRQFGLCFVKDLPPEVGQMEKLAARIGFIQENNFGLVQDLEIDPGKRSIANSFEALRLHTDEPYRASPPGILLFHCLNTCAEGGGFSTFADGFKMAEVLRGEDPKGFEILTQVRQGFRRFFEGDVDVSADAPVIAVDEFGQVMGVRINDRVASPLSIAPDQVTVFYRAYKRLLELAADPVFEIRRRLQPGDLAIFDNHRILHGRTALSLVGRRRLRWAQIELGDFHSRLRILADQLGQPRDGLKALRGAYG
ncbi:MAG: TauD/TfdA family dioxygenase [Pseudomonadota bacterium]